MEWGSEMIAGFLAKAAATKGTFAVGLIAGVLAFEFVTGGNGNIWIAILVSAISSATVAWFAHRPKMIAAQSTARTQVTADWAKLVQQLTDMHANEIKSWKEKVNDQKKEIVLVRKSKHDAIDAYGAACLWIQDLEELLREHKAAFDRFKPRNFLQIVGAEDSAMVNMVNEK